MASSKASSSRTGFNLRSKAASAASGWLGKASDALAERDYDGLADTLATARHRLNGGSARQTDILGRDIAALKKERKSAAVYSEDRLVSFPGYAALRETSKGKEVVVEVSGYAYRTRPLEKASRSQRLFVAAAKQLAGLAKLPDKVAQAIEEQMPPTSTTKQGLDGTGDVKAEAYAQLLSLGAEAKELDDAELEAELLSEEPEGMTKKEPPLPAKPSSASRASPPNSRASSISSISTTETDYSGEVGRMHINMRDRLRAFFAQKLEGRHVRIAVFKGSDSQPLARGTLLTLEGGGFRQSISFPAGEGVKPGDTLRIVAELLPDPNHDAPTVEGPHYREDECFVSIAKPGVPRVISDLDDTCKRTDVLAGTRTLIRNVFALDLKDLTVPGMGQWYREMSDASAQFHFISNSPWELAPVVRAFLNEANLPSGQILLKQYGSGSGSGLLSGLWEAAGERKRGSAEAVLRAFPESQFLCIGDSGEQDLELYCSLAAQYPHQIRAIFIRDVTTPLAETLKPPTTPGTPGLSRPGSTRTQTDPARFASQGLQALSLDGLGESDSDALSPNNPLAPTADSGIGEARRKLVEAFYTRVGHAERGLPDGIVLRIFQHGAECRSEGVALVKALAEGMK